MRRDGVQRLAKDRVRNRGTSRAGLPERPPAPRDRRLRCGSRGRPREGARDRRSCGEGRRVAARTVPGRGRAGSWAHGGVGGKAPAGRPVRLRSGRGGEGREREAEEHRRERLDGRRPRSSERIAGIHPPAVPGEERIGGPRGGDAPGGGDRSVGRSTLVAARGAGRADDKGVGDVAFVARRRRDADRGPAPDVRPPAEQQPGPEGREQERRVGLPRRTGRPDRESESDRRGAGQRQQPPARSHRVPRSCPAGGPMGGQGGRRCVRHGRATVRRARRMKLSSHRNLGLRGSPAALLGGSAEHPRGTSSRSARRGPSPEQRDTPASVRRPRAGT